LGDNSFISKYGILKAYWPIVRSVRTVKYQTEIFFVQTESAGRGLYKKTEVRYFSVHTEQARSIKRLLYGIYRHLYLKQTRNAWFEMHIIARFTFGRRKQKYQCIPSFPLTIRRYLINNKLNYNYLGSVRHRGHKFGSYFFFHFVSSLGSVWHRGHKFGSYFFFPFCVEPRA
jgi:hypothetical protein